MFGLSVEEEALLHEKVAWAILLQSVPIFLVLYFVIPGGLEQRLRRKPATAQLLRCCDFVMRRLTHSKLL